MDRFAFRSIRARWLLATFFALALSAPACADSFIFTGDGAGILWRVNTTTGAAVPVGSMGTVMTDIAFSPTGTLYAISFGALYQVNPQTGAATMIGSLGVATANALAFAPGGTLYLATTTGELRTVNPLTGASSLVGSMGYASEGDLVFSSGGALYLSARNSLLVAVNPQTGAGHAVGAIGYADIYGLAWLNQQLYALNLSGQLLNINTTTGAGTLVAKTSPRISAWGATSSPVPEPASLILFSTGVGFAAWMRRRVRLLRGGQSSS